MKQIIENIGILAMVAYEAIVGIVFVSAMGCFVYVWAWILLDTITK